MFTEFFKHNVVLFENKPFCYLCLSFQKSWSKARRHIYSQQHVNLEKNALSEKVITTKDKENFSEETCTTFVRRGIVRLNSSGIYLCLNCQHKMNDIAQIHAHIREQSLTNCGVECRTNQLCTTSLKVNITNAINKTISKITFICHICNLRLCGNDTLVKHFCSDKHKQLEKSISKSDLSKVKQIALTQTNGKLNTEKTCLPFCSLLPTNNNRPTQLKETRMILLNTSGVLYCNEKELPKKYFYICLICKNFHIATIERLLRHITQPGHKSALLSNGSYPLNLNMLEVKEKCDKVQVNSLNIDKHSLQSTQIITSTSLTIPSNSNTSKNRNNKHLQKQQISLKKLTKKNIEYEIPQDIYADIISMVENLPKRPAKVPKGTEKEKQSCVHTPRKTAADYNINYDLHCFEMEETIFAPDDKKIEILKLSYEMSCMRGNKRYCFICHQYILNKCYIYYEHVCNLGHLMKLEQLLKNVTQKKLAMQFLVELNKKKVRCCSCPECIIGNDSNIIDIHVQNMNHIKNHLKMFTNSMEDFDCIRLKLENCWYHIEIYSCVKCKIKYEFKFDFIQHLNQLHRQELLNKTDLKFDFCIPCRSLWLGFKDTYTRHCKDVTHKYILQNEEFLVHPFSERVSHLLQNVEETSAELMKISDSLIDEPKYGILKTSIKNTLNLSDEANIHLFGSRVSGLAFANSDVDVFIDCGIYETGTTECSMKFFTLAQEKFYKDTCTWEVDCILKDCQVPIIVLQHKDTKLSCDISFVNGLAVEKTKLIKSFNFANNSPCRKLCLILKKWVKLCNLNITSYTFALLVIFYLQNKSILPSVANVIRKSGETSSIQGWKVPVHHDISVSPFKKSLSELLMGFFDFYEKFDYQNEVICPLKGKAIKKQSFLKLNSLPKEMKNYVTLITQGSNVQYFRVDSAMCVQDPLDLSHNLTKALSPCVVWYFKEYCQQSKILLNAVNEKN